jgi:hypothetical protein
MCGGLLKNQRGGQRREKKKECVEGLLQRD